MIPQAGNSLVQVLYFAIHIFLPLPSSLSGSSTCSAGHPYFIISLPCRSSNHYYQYHHHHHHHHHHYHHHHHPHPPSSSSSTLLDIIARQITNIYITRFGLARCLESPALESENLFIMQN
eukprot:jgi/Botrbrau1/15252/Bobra.0228s0005.1